MFEYYFKALQTLATKGAFEGTVSITDTVTFPMAMNGIAAKRAAGRLEEFLEIFGVDTTQEKNLDLWIDSTAFQWRRWIKGHHLPICVQQAMITRNG